MFTEMTFGKPSSESNTIDYGPVLVGFSTAGYTAIIPRFYRSVSRIAQPSRFTAAILAPPICGSLAAFSWRYLVSSQIKTQKLNCAACASIRGSLILVLNGCLLPTFVVASLHFKRNTLRLPHGVVPAFLDYCYSPYYGRSKPYIMALGCFQAVLGYGLAIWIYNEEFINRKNRTNKL